MKFSLLILTFLFINTLVYSQNAEIDSRNGFKNIKLGSNISQFENIKILSSDNENNIIGIWKPTKADLEYLFDEKIEAFELHFTKKEKKLVVIKIHILINKPYVDPVIIRKYKEINDNFISVLGNPNQVSKESLMTGWFGYETAMMFQLSPNELKLNENGDTIGSSEFILSFVDLKEHNDNVEKGF